MPSSSRLLSGVSYVPGVLSPPLTLSRGSKWSKHSSGLKIVPIVTAKETFSPGDAMRDIYTRGLVTSDFVLVAGDLVSNVRIDEVVRVHKERRKTNKDAIMTMVVKESGATHRTRCVVMLVCCGDAGIGVECTRMSFGLGLEANLRYLCWTRRRQNACITNLSWGIPGRSSLVSLVRYCIRTLRLRSGTTLSTVQ
jgi:hypothetical protein